MKRKSTLFNWRVLFQFVLLVLLFSFIGTKSVHAAQGDIIDVRILGDTDHNGFTAEIDIEDLPVGGTYDFGFDSNEDPTNAKIVFTLTSTGYDIAGNSTTIVRTVYGTKRIRKAYPDHAEANETDSGGILTVKVALSDFVYDADTSITANIGAGFYTSGASNLAATGIPVTNSSTLEYPKSVGRWAWPGYERVTGDFLVEAAVFNRFARNNSQVAAVVFTATDEHSNSVTQTVTTMTESTRSGDANPVIVYAATIPVSTLTQGDIITVNFVAYPWVGDSGALLNSAVGADGFAQPNEGLGPLSFVNDKSGTYGVGYAYVTPTGNDTTGTVYSSQAAAEAGSPFLTIEKAAQAIRTYHNSNFSRDNAGGGVVLLAEGSYAFPGAASLSKGASMATWLIVKRATGTDRADTIINDSDGSGFLATKLKVDGLTLSTNDVFVFAGRANTDIIWLHDNVINLTGAEPFYYWSPAYATQNSVTALANHFSHFGSDKNPWALIRGNTSVSPIDGHVYAMLGNENIKVAASPRSFQEYGNAQGHRISDNSIYAFNTVYDWEGPASFAVATNPPVGLAIVQNLLEDVNVAAELISIAGASFATSSDNIILHHNSFPGQRQIFAYNSSGSVRFSRFDWSMKSNIWQDWNNKGDEFTGESGGNGTRTGAWPITYNVGSSGNLYLGATFRGQYDGIKSNFGGDPQFTDDASAAGSSSGNGDYTLGLTSDAIDISSPVALSDMILPYDLAGNPRYGFPDAGAYEYQPPFTMGSNEVSTSTTVRVYGDEKFRNKTTPSNGATADLSITLPGTNRSQWLDITITEWQNVGTRQKTWTETSSTTALTNTVHVVGDLDPNTNYQVSVDSVVGQDIDGPDCTAGICESDGSGEIIFTYEGSYSEHTFDIEEAPDVTAPTITSISSDKTNGTYGVGEVIDIDVEFSEAVTSTGNVIVTLETGSTDRTCQFSVSNGTTGTCNYTVQAGDTSADLTVGSVSGTIEDGESNPMVNFVPAANLAANKNLVIDTGVPDDDEDDDTTTTGGGRAGNRQTVSLYSPISTPFIFTRDLVLGSVGEDVKLLQRFLNGKGFMVASYGPGSPGNETTLFGSATQAALIKFQQANNITPASGFFGPITRLIVTTSGFSQALGPVLPAPISSSAAPSMTTPTNSGVFSRDLDLGFEGEDVKALQKYLNGHGFPVAASGPGSPGNETTRFGFATQAALANFQMTNDIIPAIGYFGPKTRAKISGN